MSTNDLIIMPVHNEAANLEVLIPQLMQLPQIHLLLVDDASSDGTDRLAARFTADYRGRFFHLFHPRAAGIGVAYRRGIVWTRGNGYRRLIQMDGDGSHRVSDLETLLSTDPALDLVVGSRFCLNGQANMNFLRLGLSKLASWSTAKCVASPFRDPTSGFSVWRSQVLQKLVDSVGSKGHAFNWELKTLAYRAGVRFIEVPIDFAPRGHGRSKLSWRHLLEFAGRFVTHSFRRAEKIPQGEPCPPNDFS